MKSKRRTVRDFLRQSMCRHVCRYSTLTPRDERGMVRAKCRKCGKEFEAEYGLAIPCTWEHDP